MKTIEEKIEFYTFLYWVYWIFSLLVVLGVIGLGVMAYITKFQEVVTVSQLFLLVLMMLFALYLRMNALHYQRLVIQLSHLPKRRPMPESNRQSPNRSHPRRAEYEK